MPMETDILTVTVTDAGADGLRFSATPSRDDVTVARQLTVTVQPVNDPPDFTLSGGINVSQKAGAQTIADFVTAISPGGGADEAAQTFTGFTVTTDPTLFSVLPSIDSQGTLTFTPNPLQFGPVNVEVTLTDTGGTGNGGTNQRTRSFLINVLAVNDAPVGYHRR